MKTALRVLMFFVVAFIFLIVAAHVFPVVKNAAGGLYNISNTSKLSDGKDIFRVGGDDELKASCDAVDLDENSAKFFEHQKCNSGKSGFILNIDGEETIENLKNYEGEDYNDKTSSLKIKNGYKTTLYVDDNLEGDHITFYGPSFVEDLSNHDRSGTHGCGFLKLSNCQNDWNDDVTSIKVKTYDSSAGPLLIVYREDDQEGSNREFYGTGCFDLTDLDFNDELSSLKIRKDYGVDLYKDIGCEDPMVGYAGNAEADYLEVDSVPENDEASSVRIYEIS